MDGAPAGPYINVGEAPVAALVRALTYATLFVGIVLVFLPARLLEWSGVVRPAAIGPVEVLGAAAVVAGAAIALWCVIAFAVSGRGTPAPFDPPRRLVANGPYRFVRNPMYIGAGTALAGAALFYRSFVLAGYLVLLALMVHGFIVWYEEPTLARLFGREYLDYRTRVHRWVPRRPAPGPRDLRP